MIARDLTGERFTRLVVDSFNHKTDRGQTMWNCACDCGNKKIVRGAHLTHGKILSCGCLKNEIHRTHRMTRTPSYNAYCNMIARCTRPSHHKYKDYGARGIKVCREWLESFESFYADMGEKPEGKSIDRIQNDGPYSPENCKWSTPEEQQRNRRANRRIEFKGEVHCLTEWAELTGISKKAIEGRLFRNWPVDKALSTPTGSAR